ncbi:MAG: hypothetical protein ABIN99_05950 [Nitrosospira sp.]
MQTSANASKTNEDNRMPAATPTLPQSPSRSKTQNADVDATWLRKSRKNSHLGYTSYPG